jgi:hypothetical protein
MPELRDGHKDSVRKKDTSAPGLVTTLFSVGISRCHSWWGDGPGRGVMLGRTFRAKFAESSIGNRSCELRSARARYRFAL